MRFPVLLVAVLALAAALGAAAPAVADHNNDYADWEAIGIDQSLTADNFGTDVEDPEQLTPTDPLDYGCINGQRGPGGVQMGGTIWYRFTGGNNQTLTLSSAGSDFNTVLAVWNGATIVRCNDDITSSRTASELRFVATPGTDYRFQLGGICVDAPCSSAQGGATRLSLRKPPSNDNRGAAVAVGHGVQQGGTNRGATEEGGEPQDCISRGEKAFIGKTVWYSFTAPTEGVAVFSATATALDTVLAVYRPGETSALGCDDDPNVAGPSRLPLELGPGTYHVQVGGYGTGVAARDGDFTYSVEFSGGIDRDGDNVKRPPLGADCDDGNRNINPSAAEIIDNTVDENCDQLYGFDRDKDKSIALKRANGQFVSGDCDDTNRRVRPGLRDIRGNRLNEDCIGRAAPYAANPARIKARYLGFPTYTLFRTLRVTSVRRRSRITVTCKGGGCPLKRRVVRVRRRKPNVRLMSNRRFGIGAVLQVRVTTPGRIGVGRRFTMRAGISPRDTDFCFRPNGRRIRC